MANAPIAADFFQTFNVFVNFQSQITLNLKLFFNIVLDLFDLSLVFFQAEDGIRDWSVTGSDVCSSDLMRRHTRLVSDWSSDVCSSFPSRRRHTRLVSDWSFRRVIFRSQQPLHSLLLLLRSEERRVGRECRSRWSP